MEGSGAYICAVGRRYVWSGDLCALCVVWRLRDLRRVLVGAAQHEPQRRGRDEEPPQHAAHDAEAEMALQVRLQDGARVHGHADHPALAVAPSDLLGVENVGEL